MDVRHGARAGGAVAAALVPVETGAPVIPPLRAHRRATSPLRARLDVAIREVLHPLHCNAASLGEGRGAARNPDQEGLDDRATRAMRRRAAAAAYNEPSNEAAACRRRCADSPICAAV
eukprot:gene7980-16288_t